MGGGTFSSRGPRKILLDDAALFREATSRNGLRAAWTKVWRNGGAAGGDRVTTQRFARRAAAELEKSMQSGGPPLPEDGNYWLL